MKSIASFLPAILVACAGCSLSVAQFAPDTVNPPEKDNVRGIDRFFRDGFPFFDARLQNDTELPTPATRQAVNEWIKSFEGVRQQAAFDALSALVPDLRMDRHNTLATPDSLRSTVAFLTPAAPGMDGVIVIQDFLNQQADLFGFDAFELRQAVKIRDYGTAHNGARHLTWQQQIDGVDIFEAQLRANLTADNRLINIGSTMLPRPEGGFVIPASKLSASEAVVAAARNVAIRVGTPALQTQASDVADTATWKVAGVRTDEPVVTRKVYFPMNRSTLRPAYEVVIPSPGIGHTYDMIVDAVDGTVLYRANRLKYAITQPITFRVYTSDSPAPGSPGNATPNAFQFPSVARQLVTVTPEQMQTYSPNGWIDDGGTETLGNNADAHLDRDGTANSPDLPRPNGGASRVFDFPMDLAAAPTSYGEAAVTQLFYLCNVYHDRLYALGFDEAAGNFQQINFSGQGVGNDRIQCDAQDGSGTNNANWSSTGTDGSLPRTQMYIFTGPTPDRDGSFDADIVFHEFSHGLSIRLHQGRLNAANQEGGMGEGWSDFYGLCLNAQPGDDFNAVYAAGAYATYQLAATFFDNYYYGIRRFPYSTDMVKNPLTYADLDSAQNAYPPGTLRSPVIGNTANEVHNVGELWCMTLLECREQLGRTMGFDANELIMRYAVDGMKLNSAANLNFLNSRDAILQADLVATGGANQPAIWRAFAKRGQGFSATSPATATAGIVEAFDVPIRVNFSFPAGTPSQLQPGVSTSFDVDLSPFGLTITPGTGILNYRVGTSGSFTPVAMTAVDSDTYRATLPAFDCFDVVQYYVSVDSSSGVFTSPGTAPTSAYSATVFQSTSTFADDNFETDTGWTVGPNTATLGTWVRADPVGTTAQPEDDTSDPGTTCWVTGNATAGSAVGAADVDSGLTTLVSPAFNLAGEPDAEVSYFRWYDNSRGGAPGADTFRVDVSVNNGTTWTPAEVVGPSGAGTTGGWVRASWSLSSLGLTPSAQTRVRFVAEDIGTGSIVEAAIDDFRITRRICVDTPACPADWNGDQGVDGDDVIAFFTDWDQSNADFNGDGGTDGDDVIAFFARWDAGC